MADRPPEMPGQMPSSFDDNHEFYNEKPLQKVFRKLKEEPLVPLGAGLTVLAFVNAYRALRKGDSKQANRMFRARVAAQGFTVVAMVAGSMFYSQDREKSKELRKIKEQTDAEEKRQKWIHELEVRDQEEKAIKERLEKRRQHIETVRNEDDSAPTEGTKGVLGKMGLWSKAEKASAEETTIEDPADNEQQQKSKRNNPRSSLGAIGEIVSTKNKDNSDSGANSDSKK